MKAANLFFQRGAIDGVAGVAAARAVGRDGHQVGNFSIRQAGGTNLTSRFWVTIKPADSIEIKLIGQRFFKFGQLAFQIPDPKEAKC